MFLYLDKPSVLKQRVKSNVLRKSDIENHNKEGGRWTVSGGFVFDLELAEKQNLFERGQIGEEQPKFFCLLFQGSNTAVVVIHKTY